ncbi:MMPL family transporter [Sinimarinibacterium sp. NLF-5-8]|uniref:MMPL family transporter n=1 Tax=Sinimarinibacterium sp. NLF-5-8 TaxID=2698684 RepID=UPI00137BE079|nr:MMPL family transporter [Sinimarinibacterium sp. NLF-5-8]QHS09851.1 MMPL family transporter [Sinimarinibacterium sp. NLF-5-8]
MTSRSAQTPPVVSLSLLARWVAAVQQHARLGVILSLLSALLMGYVVATRLNVDTDTRNMLSADLPWRKMEQALDRAFPQLQGALVWVIDAEADEDADAAQRWLLAQIDQQPDVFTDVFAAEAESFFARNGLLYLSTDQLEATALQLQQAQPFLGALAHDPSPHGLFKLLRLAVEHGGVQDLDMDAALVPMSARLTQLAQGQVEPLSWSALMGGEALAPRAADGRARRFIQTQVAMDYALLLPATTPMSRARALIAELAQHNARAQVRLTGSVALEHEELLSAMQGAGMALVIALLLAGSLLFWALRSWPLVLAMGVTLLYGLLCTATFAALAIGHLNMISVAFGVLYVGLGLNYGLYLCMQYRDELAQGQSPARAMPAAAGAVGSFLWVCAATTSIGFWAFIPTDFTGIAELGLISGTGMVISLVLSLTLLPAWVALWPARAPGAVNPARAPAWLDWPYRYARPIWVVAAVLSAGALWLLPRAQFDADPINLRDDKTESVATFKALLNDIRIPTLTLSVLADSPAAAQALVDRFRSTQNIGNAMSLLDFIPQQQDEKLSVMDDLALSVAPSLAQINAPVSAEQDWPAMAELLAALSARDDDDLAQNSGLRALQTALQSLYRQWQTRDARAQQTLQQRLRAVLTDALPAHLQQLQTALQADAVSEGDLPPSIIQRWRSADGRYRVEVWPAEPLTHVDATQRFIDAAQSVNDQVVGAPLLQLQAGQTVVAAFRQAIISALAAITLLLLFLLRSAVDTLLVLIPLLLAGLLTSAGMTLLGVPFNFANVIALPLILGVGVDYGVYLVQRARSNRQTNILKTSTARAVLFGALITLANFANLMFTHHPGTVSMGILLTVGLGTTLLCALVLLPSLLQVRERARGWGRARVP